MKIKGVFFFYGGKGIFCLEKLCPALGGLPGHPGGDEKTI